MWIFLKLYRCILCQPKESVFCLFDYLSFLCLLFFAVYTCFALLFLSPSTKICALSFETALSYFFSFFLFWSCLVFFAPLAFCFCLRLFLFFFQARLIKPTTGILIYGPPGCGKTLLARAVAKQSGAAFLSVKASTLVRKPYAFGVPAGSGGGAGGGPGDGGEGGMGHASLMVRAVFSLARKIQPCIIFLDEADGLCFKREEGDSVASRWEWEGERGRGAGGAGRGILDSW